MENKLCYIKDEDIIFSKIPSGFLSAEISGKKYKRVMLQRVFPLSKPAHYISVREIKESREHGEEIGIIEDIAKLSPEKRELVINELDMVYFKPDILKIHKLKDDRGYIYLEALTTSGERKITAQNNASAFIRLSGNRILIVDVDGNRFNIPDMSALDKKSIKYLEVVV